MHRIVKVFRRPPAVRMPDRNGGFPRLSDGVAHGFRCFTSPRHALLAESLGKPSLWVDINVLVLGADVIDRELALVLVARYLDARFSGEARHRRRLEKVAALEVRYGGGKDTA